MFGRMLNDVPVFDQLALAHSENLSHTDGRSAFSGRKTDMKKHHVVLCYHP